jgi:putative chitinase
MSFISRIAALFRRDPPETAPLRIPVETPRPEPSLAAVLAAAGMVHAEGWARALEAPCRARAIWPGRRLAAFAATIAHESAGGALLHENLNYSAAGLMKTWPSRFTQAEAEAIGRMPGKPADPQAIAEKVYAGRMGNFEPGDGWRFRGRGLIHLTGRDNYRVAGRALGIDLEARPEQAAEWGIAAQVAAWFWAERGCNDLADLGDIEGWRRRVNGGLIGLADVRKRYEAALRAV